MVTEILKPGSDLDQMYESIREEIDQFGEAQTHVVADARTADWALKKLAKLTAEDDADQKEAQAEIASWQEWLARRRQARQADVDFFNRELAVFAETQRQKDPKWKLDVPGGKVSFTVTRKDTANVVDKDVLLRFAKGNWPRDVLDEVVTVKESISATEVKKHVQVAGDAVIDEDGQVVPGFEIKHAGTAKLNIRPAREVRHDLL